MRLIDIAKKIDKSKKNEEWINIREIGNEFGLNIEHIDQERLKSYWVGDWYCSDSYVGYKMYFLDDEPVAFSSQSGRRSSESIKWFSKEIASKVKEYLFSLMTEEDCQIDFCDINEDIGEGYKIFFNTQISKQKKATLNGESIEILEIIKDSITRNILKVKLMNGEEKQISIEELEFKFNLIEEN